MEEKRTDRRITRTQSALRKALLELIQEKDYDSITVEEITARADLARTTFYLHYRDKEELLLDYFNEMIGERMQQFAQIPLSILAHPPGEGGQSGVPVRPIAAVFQHAAENASLYRLVLDGQGMLRIAEQLRRTVNQSAKEMLTSKVSQEGLKLEMPVDLLVHCFVGAFLASLAWWLEQEMPCSPEEMARRFRLLFFPGIRAVLGM
jgi:AcrR family transcriptional regulator